MRVLVNATDGVLSVRAVRRYVYELCAGLGRADSGVELHLAFFTHHGVQVRRFLAELPEGTNYKVHWLPLPRRLLNQRHRAPRRELRRLAQQVDLYHETTIDSPDFEDLPTVATIHGLCPIVAPYLLGADFADDKRRAYERTVLLSDYFAPVSETTRTEFLTHFPVAPDRARAIPLGVSDMFAPRDREEITPALRELGVDGPYLLYVGGIQPNKNIPRILRTFARLRREGVFDGKLVLAGDQHYSEDQFESLLDTEGIAGEVILPGFFTPSDERLAILYVGATLFLFPSLYEGWTSPPLEAMASGVPVIAADTSSIPETVGDAALLCDPRNENEWVLAATQLLTARERYDEYRARGLARAAEFPWSRTVDRTAQFYAEIAEGRLVPAAEPADTTSTPTEA